MSLRTRSIVSALMALSVMTGAPFAPVNAAEGEEETGGSASNKTLDLSNLVVPVELDGKLVNYLFVSVVITINDGYDHWSYRENAHVLRDLILKETHRRTVGVEGRPMELDEDKLRAAIKRVFEAQAGADSIKSIEILSSDSQKVFIDG